VLKVFGNPADGDVISLKDGKDHLIGSGILQFEIANCLRAVFSRRRQDLDQDFFPAPPSRQAFRIPGSGETSMQKLRRRGVERKATVFRA